MVQSLNAKYNDDFIFGGQATDEAPFSLDKNYNLYYRGINVDTGMKKMLTCQNPRATLPDGKKLTTWRCLEHYARKTYILMLVSACRNNGAMGDFTSSSDINVSSAMDISMPGISVIGFEGRQGKCQKCNQPAARNCQ